MTRRRRNPAFLLVLMWICLWLTTNTTWVSHSVRVTAQGGRCNLPAKARQGVAEGSPERVNPLSEDAEELRSQASKLRSMALSQRERAAGLRDRAEVLRDRAEVLRDRAAVLRDQADEFQKQGQWDRAEKLEDRAEKLDDRAEKVMAEAEKVVAEADRVEDRAERLVAEAEKLEDQAEKREDRAKELSANKDAASRIQTPSLRVLTPDDFVADLKECKRPKTIVDRVGMIGVQECVAECLGKVERWLPAESATAADRVPPVMLSRCMRGGKTTILCATFDKLKAEGYNPIFVSFNGDFNIKQLPREVDTIETLTRAIGIALMKSPPSMLQMDNVVCPPDNLLEYLADKEKVVLVIDELNALLKLGGGDGDRHARVGAFLRATFLDSPGRYLIFSTHLPRTAGIDELLGYGSGSVRNPIALTMPTSNNLTALRNMAQECRALTGCEATYFSFIPALIYTTKLSPDFDFESRFDLIEPKPPVDDGFISAFLNNFFAGKRDSPSPLRMFDILTSVDGTTQRWILGYVGLMCNWIASHSEHKIFSEVGRLINNLKVTQEGTGSGKEWEIICQIAILLRSLQARFTFEVDPLLQILNQTRPRAVYFRIALSMSVAQEKADWQLHCEAQAAEIRYPHLVMLAPQSHQFPTYDILLIYWSCSTAPMQVIGYQCKTGKDTPQDASSESNHSVLLCGRTPKQVSGWVCPNEKEVRGFLGPSLEGNYPRAWAK